MIETALRYSITLGILLTAAVWAYVIIQRWGPAARARGGEWYLEALLAMNGPILTALIFLYPSDQSFTGPFPGMHSTVSWACVALSVLAIFASLKKRRIWVSGMVLAVIAFYLALILSGIGGVVPGVPEFYWTTPISILAFLLHGEFTLDWFMRAIRFNLRLLLILSFATIVIFPNLAFNTVEPRTIFGIARLQGVAGHPNTLAMVAALALLLEICTGRSKVWKVAAACALILAQSHTAWIAVVIALACLRLRGARALRWTLAVSATAAAIGFVTSGTIAATISGFLTDANTESLNGRSTIWNAALVGFQQNPILGYGSTLLDDSFRNRYLPNFDAAAQSHNQFVQSLASSGLVGLATLVVLLLVLLVYAVRVRRDTGGLSLALMVLVFCTCLTETPLRPTGPGWDTFALIAITVSIAVAHSKISLNARDLHGQTTVSVPNLRHTVPSE